MPVSSARSEGLPAALPVPISVGGVSTVCVDCEVPCWVFELSIVPAARMLMIEGTESGDSTAASPFGASRTWVP
jgi:hypothetical protein